MRNLFSLLTVFVSSVAWASCPEITGHFENTQKSHERLSIEDHKPNLLSIHSPLLGQITIIPDGTERSTSSQTYKGTHKASCNGEELSIRLSGSLLKEGKKKGDINASLSIVTNQLGISVRTQGEIRGADIDHVVTWMKLP